MSTRTRFAAVLVAASVAAAPAVAQARMVDSHTTTDHAQGTVHNVRPTDRTREMGLSALSSDPGPGMETEGIPATPSLVGQWVCHSVFAPDKETWNLEDWRPAVGFPEMVSSRCNPNP